MTAQRIAIVGAGISGLAAAFTLVDEAARTGLEIDITLLEAANVAGGHARTVAEGGFLVESGPNGFLDREPETLALIESLGLTGRLVESKPAAKRRFVVRGGRLQQAPDSPWTLLTTGALSPLGKVRLLLEPFARKAPPGVEETVFDFASRRIGPEAADMLVDAAVAGISAGDSRALSVRAQFPLMVEMEREHGGLIRALVARRRRGVKAPKLLSFDGGMGVLTCALVERLGARLRTGQAVRAIERSGRGFRLRVRDGHDVEADQVLLALPATAASHLVEGIDPELSRDMRSVAYSGIAVVAMAFEVSDLPASLDGYGYLVTRDEKLATLGVVWESCLFPGRAPEGYVLVRAFMGGARRPEVLHAGDEVLLARAHADLAPIMGVFKEPSRHWVFRWPNAIAQYTVGHLDRIARIRERLRTYPGLAVAGASYDGCSFNQAIVSGRARAREVSRSLSGTEPVFSRLPANAPGPDL